MSVSVAGIAAAATVGATVYSASKSASASKDATAAARASASEQAAVDRERLGFDMKAYEDQMQSIADLEEIFGPIRENLSNYYSNVSPQMYEMRGKDAIENEFKKAQASLDATFSQNGMFNSGQMINAKTALEAARAEANAKNTTNAGQQYAAEQASWLTIGLNEQSSMRGQAVQQQGLISNAYGQQAANIGSQGNTMANLYNQQSQAWSQTATGAAHLGGYLATKVDWSNPFGSKTQLGNLYTGQTSPVPGSTQNNSLFSW